VAVTPQWISKRQAIGWIDPGERVSAGRIFGLGASFRLCLTGLVPFSGQPDHGAEQDANYKICRKGDHNITPFVRSESTERIGPANVSSKI
jgi:hypothetical protein